MGYLISEIILCLIAATLLGLILGWLLRSILCRKSDTQGLQARLQECHGDNTQLRSRVSTLTAKSGGISNINAPSNEITSLKAELQEVTAERNALISDLELSGVSSADTHLARRLRADIEELSDSVSTDEQKELEREIYDSSPLSLNEAMPAEQYAALKASAGYATAGSSFIDQSSNEPSEDRTPAPVTAETDSENLGLRQRLEQAEAQIIESNEQLQSLTTLISEREVELEKFKAGGGISAATFAAEAGIQADAEKESYDIQEIEGIGPGFGRRLRKEGIQTTLDLLNNGSDDESLNSLAEAAGIEAFIIRKWVSMADLIRVSGIRGQFAELVEASGVHSVQSLALQNGESLNNTMAEVNKTEHRTPVLPTQGMVESWIVAAEKLPVIIKT